MNIKSVTILISVLAVSFNVIAQDISKGKLLYENSLADDSKVKDWTMEGPGKIEFKDNWLHMYSPEEKGHHVFWCPKDFPGNFIAEWEAQDIETDAGLCIIFFSAKGLKGESIFDSTLPKRTEGTFTDYTKGPMNNYHISYYANGKDHPGRLLTHIRKNKGFFLVQDGEPGIPIASTAVHRLKLVKNGGKILMYVDDRKIIDWLDDGVKYGKILEDGKMGFRQMQWTHFAYRNFKVWEIASNTK
jgi:hypothetical protein